MERYNPMADIHSRAFNGYQCISREGAYYREDILVWIHDASTFKPFVDNLKKTLKPCPKCGCDKIFLHCHLHQYITNEDRVIIDDKKVVFDGETFHNKTYRSNPVWINPNVDVYWYCSECNYSIGEIVHYPYEQTHWEEFRECIVDEADAWDYYAKKGGNR